MDENGSILIVDDDPTLRETLFDVLGAKGYVPIVASSGKKAIEMVKETAPVVALIDLRLEDMSGLELMEVIKENSPGTECVVITGYASKASAINAVNLGAYGFVEKPYDVDQLLLLIRRALEKQQAEKALRESRERYRDLYENAPNSYFSVNTVDGTILRCNTAATRLFGCDKKSFLSRKVFDLYADTPDGLPKAKEVFQRFKAGESIKDVELQMKHADGHPIWISLSVDPVEGPDGCITESRSMVIDISDRKQLEIQVQQAQKMESIGTLAGGIAHDFNNILGIIVGNAELAMDDVPDWNPAHHHLQEVRKACLRARDVVRQILTFGRRTEQKHKPIDICPIIDESLKLLRSSIPTTIEIRHFITNDSLIISADPTQINQVLFNLCTNSSHAMRGKGGLLEVSLQGVELEEDSAALYHDLSPGKYVKLTVSDTGHGIEPGVLERIFDPYFTTKNVGEGTGMGLAVVHGIVNNLGGSISVDTEPGRGTTVHIFFPRIKSEAKSEIETVEPLSRGNERILFIDDEEEITQIGKLALERLGYDVHTEKDPLEALKVFEETPDRFDMVISDMTMPKMTGEELARDLMKIRPDVRIILCSGFSDMMNEEKAKKMGIGAFIMKPVSIRELANATRRVLDDGRK